MAKITVATVKSFIRKNEGSVFFACKSQFDGMTDCVESRSGAFRPLVKSTRAGGEKYDMGYNGVWFVGHSRDLCEVYDNGDFYGYEVYNCTGCWVVALPKQQLAA